MRAQTHGWRIVAVATALAGCGVTSDLRGLNTDAGAPFDATSVGDDTGASAPEEPDAGTPAHHDAAASPPTEAGNDAGVVDDADAAADASPDGPVNAGGPPQSGPFLDGSCPYDADFPLDGNTRTADDAGPDAHVPDVHRPAALCCPVTRDPGTTTPVPWCSPDAASSRTPCFTDSNCNKGTNGRCTVFPAAPGVDGCQSECTYDECFSDVDCPGHVPCDCRAFGYNTNVCRTGSLCNVDSDCGQGGFCSPALTGNAAATNAYYCHRPRDVCFNNSDCPPARFGARCQYDTSANQWRCIDNPAPP